MRIAVLGGGAWGTAIALVAANRHEVGLFVRDPVQAEALSRGRENTRYLPAFLLPENVRASADLSEILRSTPQLIVIATPTNGLRSAMQALARSGVAAPVVWLCKGFERDTGLLAHQIAAQELGGHPTGPLSGPSFAQEVAAGQPTALTVAGSESLCDVVTVVFHAGALRVYATDDVTGVEVGRRSKKRDGHCNRHCRCSPAWQ
jgi:glycerol-3-phosphate dehydrogenase (NAD(P)+)